MSDSNAQDPLATTDSLGAAPAVTKLPSGTPTRIGRFEIRALLGEGAFGRVYRGYDAELRRDVAIKVPHSAGLNKEFRERFLREARSIAAIHNPNVCPVYEVGTDGELPYIVMRFVAGTTLANVIDGLKTPMPVKNAVMIMRKLALGMAAAHAQGVTHRDLKPANVLYDTANREVLITDFGLARIGGEANLTAKDSFLGTPAYTSPEQANRKADQVGPLSDVYSLGVILYEMLTGDVPFNGSVMEVAIAHCITVPDPPSKRRAGIDAKLDAIVLKAMEKKPADRFKSAREFADVLTDYLRPTDPQPGSVPEMPVVGPASGRTEPAAETVAEKQAGKRTAPAIDVAPAAPQPVIELDEDEEDEAKPSPRSSARKSARKSGKSSGVKPPKSGKKKKRAEDESPLAALLQNKVAVAGGVLGFVALVLVVVLVLRGKSEPQTVTKTPEPPPQQPQQPSQPQPEPPPVKVTTPPNPVPPKKTETAEDRLRTRLSERWEITAAPGLTGLIQKAKAVDKSAYICLEFRPDGTAILSADSPVLDVKFELARDWKKYEMKYHVVGGSEIELSDLPTDLPRGAFNGGERMTVQIEGDTLTLTDELGTRQGRRVKTR